MVNLCVIPYAPSARWYAAWLRNLTEGDPESGIPEANAALKINGKDFAHTLIAGNCGNQMLSIAIEGGASRLKRGTYITCATLSDHGNWRKIHTGAIEASYGKAPYYPYLMPLLTGIYEDMELTGLRDFNTAIHKKLLELLIPGREVSSSGACAAVSEAVQSRGKEIAARINPDLSVIDSLMHFGPETLLALSIL